MCPRPAHWQHHGPHQRGKSQMLLSLPNFPMHMITMVEVHQIIPLPFLVANMSAKQVDTGMQL